MMQLGFDDPRTERQFWVIQLVSEGTRASRTTVAKIRTLRPVDDLLELLQDEEAETRAAGTGMLWTIWMGAAGDAAERTVRRGIDLIGRERLEEAEALFTDLIAEYPEFAEAYNKRATVRYLAGMPQAAIADCEAALRHNPIHFGAWHGLGLCHEARNAYREAAAAYEEALALQPYAEENRRHLERCRARLQQSAGGAS